MNARLNWIERSDPGLNPRGSLCDVGRVREDRAVYSLYRNNQIISSSNIRSFALTTTMASQVAPSACLSRFAEPTYEKTYMRINTVPLMPHVESQPAAPKKHWIPNHQLQKKDRTLIRLSWGPHRTTAGSGLTRGFLRNSGFFPLLKPTKLVDSRPL